MKIFGGLHSPSDTLNSDIRLINKIGDFTSSITLYTFIVNNVILNNEDKFSNKCIGKQF
jgi:hypothetical protein